MPDQSMFESFSAVERRRLFFENLFPQIPQIPQISLLCVPLRPLR